MKPPAFDYVRAESVEETLAALAEEGDEARILAGGQSLVPMLNYRLVAPKLLVDIGNLGDLAAIEADGAAVRVGATVTQAQFLAWPGLAESLPLLAQALPDIGHYQIRLRGTVCGSIAHADPSAELPLCLVALSGTIMLRSRREARDVAADAFFSGALSTTRAPEEMIVAVRFPKRRSGCGYAFREFAMRRGDFALVAVAAIASDDGMRIAVGGVGDRPRACDLPPLADAALADALNAFAWELEATDDHFATAAYRRGLVRSLGRQAVAEAMRCRG